LDTVFSTPGYPYVYVIRNLYDFETWTKIGILIIGFSENNLLATYSSYAKEYENIYLTDTSCNIISSVGNLNLPDSFKLPLHQIDGFEKGNINIPIGNDDYLLTFTRLKSPFWKVIILTSLRIPLSSSNYVKNSFIILIIIYVVIVCISSFFISNAFLRPIHDLSQNISKMKEGNFDIRTDIRSNDEMADLAKSFKEMAYKVKLLLENIVKEQESKRKLELIALQTQVNPHLIYNTLASIRYMVSVGDKEKADEIILSLIKLLNNTLSNLDELITVEKELDILKSYIRIQQLACDIPFESIIEVDSNVRHCLIPKLILQPIVENAILHGLRPNKDNGKLLIQGKFKNNMIEFVIQDNGIGFEIDNTIVNRSEIESGIGINNVKGRLLLHFGQNFSFDIFTKRGQGTKITICMPFIIEDEGVVKYEYSDS
jgi:two-component system sensor histidine kinase YesM